MNFMRSKAGFTLVELIVVIAILGILAGVAIPVYSGYIKKANKAADDQVVVSIDTAIAAAVSENGLTVADADACMTVTFASATGTATFAQGSHAKAADVFSDFKDYFGSDKAIFEYYTDVDFADTGKLTLTAPN